MTQALAALHLPQGYLLVEEAATGLWKRRYFCLCGSDFYYYYSEEMSNPFQPLGIVSLHEGPPERPVEAGVASSAGGSCSGLEGGTTGADSSLAVAAGGEYDGERLLPVSLERIVGCPIPYHGAFALHTRQGIWRFAAPMAEGSALLDQWVHVLTQAGACLVASSQPLRAAAINYYHPPSATTGQWPACGQQGGGASSTSALADGASGGGGAPPPAFALPETSPQGAAAEQRLEGLRGTLWKRGSKVHVDQAAEDPEGLPREWVQRHFVLMAEEALLLYVQNEGAPWTEACGLVPLASYDAVSDDVSLLEGQGLPSNSESQGPSQLYPFQLLSSTRPPVLLAAPSAEEKAAWMTTVSRLLAASGHPTASASTEALAAAATSGTANPATDGSTGREAVDLTPSVEAPTWCAMPSRNPH